MNKHIIVYDFNDPSGVYDKAFCLDYLSSIVNDINHRSPQYSVVVGAKFPDFFQDVCRSANINLIRSDNVTDDIYGICNKFISSSIKPYVRSSNVMYAPLIAKGCIVDPRDELFTATTINTDNHQFARISEWLSLAGFPNPILKSGLKKSEKILERTSLQEFLKGDIEGRVEEYIASQYENIARNKKSFELLGKSLSVQNIDKFLTTKIDLDNMNKTISNDGGIAVDIPIKSPITSYFSLKSLFSRANSVNVIPRDGQDLGLGLKVIDYDSVKYVDIISDRGNKITIDMQHAGNQAKVLASFLNQFKGNFYTSDFKCLSDLCTHNGFNVLKLPSADMKLLEAFSGHKTDDLDIGGIEAHMASYSSKCLNTYYNIETSVIPILSKIQKNGIPVDSEKFRNISLDLTDKIARLSSEIEKVVGLNPSAKDEFKSLMKKTLGVDKFNTDTLEPLSGNNKLANMCLQWVKLKAKLTGFNQVGKYLDNNSKLRTIFSSTTAVTGRLSSSRPPLQNLSKEKGETGIRSCFTSTGDKNSLIAIDYNQMELVILAIIAGSKELTYACKNGIDLHKMTAAQVFDKSINDVSVEERRAAKTINFGLIYGKTSYSLARELDLSIDDTNKIIDRFFDKMPNIRDFISDTKKQAKVNGFVETLAARKIPIEDIQLGHTQENKSDKREISKRIAAAERKCVNYRIQPSAAEMVKAAMIECQNRLEEKYPECSMVLQVHDEIVFDAPDHLVKEVSCEMASIMKDAFRIAFDIDAKDLFQVSAKHGKNLNDMEDLDLSHSCDHSISSSPSN